MSELPFEEIHVSNDTRIRKFMQSSEEGEFVWHRDEEDRLVICERETDWMLQIDNDLPIELSNCRIYIPSGKWHRIIKGSGDLEVQIRINNKDETSIHI